MESLFNDISKFTLLQEYWVFKIGTSLRNPSSVQIYLNALHKRNRITLEDKKLMRPKFAQLGRPQGLPKTPKDYQDIPPFFHIVDTTSTPYYGIAKYLSSLILIHLQ